MSFINIISAIGNNSSVYPLIVRDCGIEVPTKVALTYSQNLKESKETANNALRERLIDEYGTSAVWLGGIPLVDSLCNKVIKKLGYNPNINPKMFKDNKIIKNIEKYKNISPNEVKELEKVLNNKKTYESLLTGKFVLSTAIPAFIMGFILPKANYKLTSELKKQKENNNTSIKNVSFKGITSTIANMSNVNKMAITDGGLAIGRVYTGRNKFEKMEMAFKMFGMMFLNFIAPIFIAQGLNKITNKIFNTNVNLDPQIIADNDFIKLIKSNQLNLPKDNEIETYLENKPNEIFSKYVNKFLLKNKLYKNGKIDCRVYVDKKEVLKFKNEMEKFKNEALKSGNVEKFATKALKIKTANILTNITISSLLLAVGLPKLTFILRKKITGSDAEPGLT